MYIRSGTISAKHFYDLQKAGNYASASQITPIQYFQSFEPALSAETTFVSVFSSGMSGTFQSAQVCAEELREDAFLQKGVLSFIL
ncbi:DegV family protein [uncultured Oscillibacter sp.]|uniref:DegV family protein n=1 Tax=uncultured Oscillibacter sp. TaxID=876091 RepID=UPI0035A6D666